MPPQQGNALLDLVDKILGLGPHLQTPDDWWGQCPFWQARNIGTRLWPVKQNGPAGPAHRQGGISGSVEAAGSAGDGLARLGGDRPPGFTRAVHADDPVAV